MPKKLHDRLSREARRKGLTGEKFDAYVYGTMNKIESRHKKKRKPKNKT